VSPDTLLQHFDAVADAPTGVQKLRELILQLAVRGKLVPQDPSDEPALSKSEHSLTYLPTSWSVVQLGDVTEIIRGITFPGSAKSTVAEPSTVACLRTANVQDEIDWDDLIYVSDEYVRRGDQWVRPGDLIISMANSLELVGKVALVRDVPLRASFGGFLAAIRPSPVVEPQFLFVLLRSPEILQVIRSTASRTTNIANVSLKGLRPIELPLPPTAEQRRIVEKVDQLMALCDDLEQRQQRRAEARVRLNRASLHHLTAAIDGTEVAEHWQRIRDNFHLLYDAPETVTELRQAIFQLAVRGKLVPQDPSDESASVLLEQVEAEKQRLYTAGKIGRPKPLVPIKAEEVPFELPAGWEWVRLGVYCQFIDYRGKTPTKTADGVRLFTAKNIRMGYIRDEPAEFISEATYQRWMTRGFPEFGDVLFTTEAPLANVALLDTRERIALAQRVINFHPFLNQAPDWLVTALRSPAVQELIHQKATGTTAMGIKSSRLQLVLVPIPPAAEQRRIVKKVNQLMGLCDELEVKLTRSRTKAESLASAVVHHLIAA
jgi:type I restriction enzyme S subunit